MSFTPPQPLNTAILFLVFNRLATTQQVFEAIREVKPPRLYIAADGARESIPGEAEKVMVVRDFILKNINWKCEIKTLFRDENLGCKYAVSGAIDWFFEQEEMGVILEDDCLPSQSFFWFCEEMLVRYKDDMRIGQVSGFNPVVEVDANGDSYLFSKFGPIWGWASWRRAWKSYDVEMSSWPTVKDSNIINDIVDSKLEKEWRTSIFSKVYNNEIDTWDYQWAYAKLINSFLTISPAKNLIKNIGFGEDATHTTGDVDEKLFVTFEIYDVVHPMFIIRNNFFEKNYLKGFVKIENKIISIIKRIFYLKKN